MNKTGRPRGGLNTLTNPHKPLKIEPTIYAHLLRTQPHFKVYKRLRDLKTGFFSTEQLRGTVGSHVTAEGMTNRFVALDTAGLIQYRNVVDTRGWVSHMISVEDIDALKKEATAEVARDFRNDTKEWLSYFRECYQRKGLPHTQVYGDMDAKLAGQALRAVGSNLHEAKLLVKWFFSQPPGRFKEWSVRDFHNNLPKLIMGLSEAREVEKALTRQGKKEQHIAEDMARSAAASGMTVEEYEVWVREDTRAHMTGRKVEYRLGQNRKKE